MTVNERITFEGGKITGIVKEVLLDEIKLQILEDGEIRSESTIKLEGKRYEFMPLLREEDKASLKEIIGKYNFDYVSLPSVVSAKDLQ